MENSAEDSRFCEEPYITSDDATVERLERRIPRFDFESPDDDSFRDKAIRPPRLDPRGLSVDVFRVNIGFAKAEVGELGYLFKIPAWRLIFP